MTGAKARARTLLRKLAQSPWNAARLISLAVLISALMMPTAVRAQDPASDPRQLLSPVSDVLSASSWLWAIGLDPRDPVGSLPTFGGANELPAAIDPLPERGSRDVLVTRQVGVTPVSAEPALAIDPSDPRRFVLAVSALDLPSPAVYVSEDGGGNWDGPIQVPVQAGNERSVGAPVVAFDRQGVLYLAAQTVRADELTASGLPVSIVGSRISVARSDDSGRTWQGAVVAVQGEMNLGLAPDASGMLSGGLSIGFLDSPSLVVAPNPRQSESDSLTLAYTEFLPRFNVSQSPSGAALIPSDAASTIRTVQSTDGGASWSDPISVSPPAMRGITPPPTVEAPLDTIDALAPPQPDLDLAAPGDQVVQGARMTAFGDGSLAVAYLDSTLDGPHQGLARVMVATSADGGRTFADPVVAAVFREITAQPATAFFRWWDSAFPSIAAASDNDLVIAVSTRAIGYSDDESDILIAHSPDRGASWDVPVAGESRFSGSDFFPALGASGDGTLVAGWLILGEEPASAGYRLNLIASDDGGISWRAVEGSSAGVDEAVPNALLGYPGGLYLGGRIAVAANEQTLVAWPETPATDMGEPGQQISVRIIASG